MTSPTSNGKIRKRRAPSGVNKIKFVGDKKIKQAIEVISNQNEFLKQQSSYNQKRATPIKALPDTGLNSLSITNELNMLIR